MYEILKFSISGSYCLYRNELFEIESFAHPKQSHCLVSQTYKIVGCFESGWIMYVGLNRRPIMVGFGPNSVSTGPIKRAGLGLPFKNLCGEKNSRKVAVHTVQFCF